MVGQLRCEGNGKDGVGSTIDGEQIVWTYMKLKSVKMTPKKWVIETEYPRKLTQDKIDRPKLTTDLLDEDLGNVEKQSKVNDLREDLQSHYERLERDAKQLTHV